MDWLNIHFEKPQRRPGVPRDLNSLNEFSQDVEAPSYAVIAQGPHVLLRHAADSGRKVSRGFERPYLFRLIGGGIRRFLYREACSYTAGMRADNSDPNVSCVCVIGSYQQRKQHVESGSKGLASSNLLR